MTRSSPGSPQDHSIVSLEERQLLIRHRNGDPDAFAALLARYRGPVYGYLVRFGVEPASRDDLFQEVFLKVHRAAGSYRADRPLHPWIFTIVANTVRSHYRRQRVRALVFPDEPRPEPPCERPDSREELEARETATRVARALRRLPPAQREALLLHCIEDLPQREVSRILGVPINTVKTHVRRGRAALARALARAQRGQS